MSEELRRVTAARLSLGRSGATSTEELLRFRMDHAVARDAVHAGMAFEGVGLRSGASGRAEYLRRPDLGRRLDAESVEKLRGMEVGWDVVMVVVDGLSGMAVERHATGVVKALRERLAGWRVGPVCVVEQGRVAIGDEVAELLGAKVVVVLIGERPGLSAADSLGIYVTWGPRVGRMDAERNCVSNVREGGLGYAEAAERVAGLMREMRRLGVSGVALKEADATRLL
jgi:ethanolamine ammonia-lyase small subunit